jgi:hypothetical protein
MRPPNKFNALILGFISFPPTRSERDVGSPVSEPTTMPNEFTRDLIYLIHELKP